MVPRRNASNVIDLKAQFNNMIRMLLLRCYHNKYFTLEAILTLILVNHYESI